MDFMQHIEQQLSSTKLPLFAISVAAVPCPETPVVLTLHWHAFLRERLAEHEQATTVRYRPVPSSAIQLNMRWDDLFDLDRAAMDAAWALGAWDIARAERPACMRPGAPALEAMECLQAFGAYAHTLQGDEVVVAETPDADELVNVAARRGYLTWVFRPVHGGVWHEYSEDQTLKADGTREPPCPMLPVAPKMQGARKTVYQFGRAALLS